MKCGFNSYNIKRISNGTDVIAKKPVERIFQRFDKILSEVLDGILENAGDEIFVRKMGVAVALSIVLLKGTG